MRTDLLVNDFTLEQLRQIYCSVDDFKRNYIMSWMLLVHSFTQKKHMKGNIYNVGLSEANLSKKELCLKIKDQIPDFSIFDEFNKDPDQRNYIVSNAKIEKLVLNLNIQSNMELQN